MHTMKAAILMGMLSLSGCGAAYFSPSVEAGVNDASKVRVVSLTSESVMLANRSPYRPKTLPAVFSQVASSNGALRGTGALPEPAFAPETRPAALETRIPPAFPTEPYRIGVGDVLLLATPKSGNTVEQLSGLLAAQNSRQGYTVQDDGTIAIPDVGRVSLAGMSVDEAEAELFQRLVENQIEPAFSLEIAEFNSKKVSIGGAVARPTVAAIKLTPLYLDEALAATGGVTTSDMDYASVRIYRDGGLYQIPLAALYDRQSLKRIQLKDGDSVFVDTEYELEKASAYFEQQIKIAEVRRVSRIAALDELELEINLRRLALNEARVNFQSQVDFDAVERDYVYLAGEVSKQGRYTLPFNRTASLADALYDQGEGIPTETGNIREVYLIRGSDDPMEFSAITAWHLDARNAANLMLATKLTLRPNDIIFVAEQPVTKWGRVIRQITPSLITTPISAAAN